jgi:hypothetical protein
VGALVLRGELTKGDLASGGRCPIQVSAPDDRLGVPNTIATETRELDWVGAVVAFMVGEIVTLPTLAKKYVVLKRFPRLLPPSESGYAEYVIILIVFVTDSTE